MIKMTKIKLGEVVNFYDGYPFSKLEQQDKGDFNYIKITNFSSGEIILDRSKINKPVKYREENILNGNEIIVAMSGSTGKAAFNTYKNILVNQRIAILRAKEDIVIPKYLRHLLVNSNFETYCNKLGTGLQKNISKETIANYEFNLPSLKVQNEIVEVLDKFTELEAELEAELTARTKQYEYYRNKLLDFSTGSVGVPRIDKMLAEMCPNGVRSEEHTSELQSRPHLVCRLLLEKKKKHTHAQEAT